MDLQDKQINMEKDFTKTLEMCQAMLVYAKDEHFRAGEIEQQLDTLKHQQVIAEAESKSAMDQGHRAGTGSRERAEQDQLLTLEDEVRRLAECLNQRERQVEE